jgi:hypothetical protein
MNNATIHIIIAIKHATIYTKIAPFSTYWLWTTVENKTYCMLKSIKYAKNSNLKCLNILPVVVYSNYLDVSPYNLNLSWRYKVPL